MRGDERMNEVRMSADTSTGRAGGRARRAFAWGAVALLLLAGACGKREKVTPPDDTLTPIERVTRGWQSFSAGNFDSAVTDFSQAANDSVGYADAHLGLGWARLSRATGAQEISNAISSFDAAVNLGLTADAKGGRAAARLAQGGTSLSSAISDAAAALAASPTFVFAHRASFDVKDLHLIAAFAQAGQQQYAAALSAADQVAASGIQSGNPSTWVVDGVTLPSFPTAVLAYLNKLSNQFAG